MGSVAADPGMNTGEERRVTAIVHLGKAPVITWMAMELDHAQPFAGRPIKEGVKPFNGPADRVGLAHAAYVIRNRMQLAHQQALPIYPGAAPTQRDRSSLVPIAGKEVAMQGSVMSCR